MTNLVGIPVSQLERLRYIEFCLKFLGAFSRSDLIDKFGIGTAAASRDISLYKEKAPQNFSHSSNSKNFALNDSWESLFEFSSSEVLNLLTGRTVQSNNRSYIPNDILDVIDDPKIDIIAPLSRAIYNKKAIQVDYFSNSSGFSTKLLIPHAYIHNGSRWHVRAYDRTKSRFADFLISRFRKLEIIDEDALDNEYQTNDNQWNRIVDLEIIPHPDYAEPEAVIYEFNMEDGVLRKSIRASSVGYFLQKLKVDCSKTPPEKNFYRLKLKNRLALYGIENMHLVPSFEGFEE
ncbi:MAG: WYL domain-containing protein [Colwellia sp.]|nr:WYL domain-containing protein [Colwellia sp.]MCW9081223.1 WYL domain-containing protein [Colwellia sp.]